MTRIRTCLMTVLFLGIGVFPDAFAWAEDKLDPEAIALLQSIQKTREQTKPFRVKGQLLWKQRNANTLQSDVEILYDDGKYRIKSELHVGKIGQIATTVFDGKQYLNYTHDDRSLGQTTIVNPLETQGRSPFDPRVIGISEFLRSDYKLRDYLEFPMATRIELEGPEIVAGAPVKIVSVTDRSGEEVRLWIDPAKSFRVVKCSRVWPIKRGGSDSITVSESVFWPDAAAEWVPRKVTIVKYDTDEETRVVREMVLTLEKPVRPVQISPDTWTLRGLGLPAHRIVISPQTNDRIGFWDGENLTFDPVDEPLETANR